MALGVEAKSKPSATAGARLFQTVNPAKGENGRAYEGHTIHQAKSIASDVYEAQIAWRRTLFAARSAMMVKAAHVIRQNRDRYAKQEFLQQYAHARARYGVLRRTLLKPAVRREFRSPRDIGASRG